ncbi:MULTISPECIES: HesB/YadR/YfhF family protein [Enterococcaceae]|uniref:HesB/YadR/YfhF family protein n=1 Tax=Enterococcaceae TaxID=81852 RepID=UPI000E52F971|nr:MULTISPECIES: HesB/YadR/YfhF family protein [Enterococcaceae]MCI0130163.1 HesB/YadR/YfhF family protein [Vagococcus sp. CY53-2]RGI31026.1 HesB/YadR/YfhF family protein [Melissococcus sp. OM08-11BH]UNM88987.1 HesB/YadR/YfhF family protein [Vagococcus sp. CY52-2]
MKLIVTDDAHKWFVEELGIESGDFVRLFGKYGGSTNVHVGFSTGIQLVEPENPLITTVIDGITYFVEQADDWFFTDYTLTVGMDNTLNEPNFTYA